MENRLYLEKMSGGSLSQMLCVADVFVCGASCRRVVGDLDRERDVL